MLLVGRNGYQPVVVAIDSIEVENGFCSHFAYGPLVSVGVADCVFFAQSSTENGRTVSLRTRRTFNKFDKLRFELHYFSLSLFKFRT